ncbi:hypothetical protein Q4603_05790 [Zobellia galactanivorans]|uniref:hypothetical protein n=1 Tax=Zobellia galactanivorans (strain DSM 12802 / CCUG 47099 / CIP 106680 / NCIMB 13871 / Dsij) TaxID=63186 RepID=UPI0026E2323A|nr:hypothetical protein [Zobellia galactanivorans]MDO6808107.1 hypothetical protein [Zobellia galactanivorans]
MIIEDVKIELTSEKIDAIVTMLDIKTYPVTEIRSVRAKQNILAETFLKLFKKNQVIKSQPPTTRKKKKKKTFGVRLKYHEADVLEEFLRHHAKELSDPYDFALVSGVADILHQKLI